MKMLIDKIKLKLLLEQKRDYLRNSIDGIDIVITALLYVVSLLCSDFHDMFGIDYHVIETVSWILAIVIFGYGIYKVFKSINCKYDHNMLYTDIENLNEITHRFSIVAIKDSFNEYPNRFLLYYDTIWQCWFFFNFATSEYDNEKNISERLSNKLKINPNCINVRYFSDRLQPKFSERDHVNKVYQHSLYEGKITDFTQDMRRDSFEIDGVDYKWWTIDEMEADSVIMEKNSDVVAFVKEKIV